MRKSWPLSPKNLNLSFIYHLNPSTFIFNAKDMQNYLANQGTSPISQKFSDCGFHNNKYTKNYPNKSFRLRAFIDTANINSVDCCQNRTGVQYQQAKKRSLLGRSLPCYSDRTIGCRGARHHYLARKLLKRAIFIQKWPF